MALQDGVLSPLLFNLYIDGIKNIFDDSCDPVQALNTPISHLLYADDLVLMSTSHQGLNNCLDKLSEFCTCWKLELNPKKSQIMIFNSSGRLLSGYSFKCQGKPLQVVKNYCYLGVDLACSGSFRIGKMNIMEKARKAMSPLLSIIPNFKISCKDSLNLFHSFIRPIVLYNSENLAQFTHHQIRAIEENKTSLIDYLTKSETNTVHQKFLKFVLGVKRNCSNMATLGELGEFPLHLYGLISLLSYWHRLTQMQEDTLVKQALNLVTNNGPDFSEWFATVKFLLKILNMEEYLPNPESITTKKFSHICSRKLQDLIVEQWKTNVLRESSHNGHSNKLRFYSLFKTEFKREPYLENVNDFHIRKKICKFRCSDHNLEIEKGRHKNISVEERICQICNSDIETEMHFLAICPLFGPLRKHYLDVNHDNDFINLLKCSNKADAFKIGNFITKATKLRENVLKAQ